VAENLLQNALAKRLREPGLSIGVTFVAGALSVSDSGSAIAEGLANALMNEPVASEDGLGIGLYQAARQADSLGYRLALTDNRDGRVVFTLSPRP
jgi:C4-dicarboxylate-specific signal transduction histidine kinase